MNPLEIAKLAWKFRKEAAVAILLLAVAGVLLWGRHWHNEAVLYQAQAAALQSSLASANKTIDQLRRDRQTLEKELAKLHQRMLAIDRKRSHDLEVIQNAKGPCLDRPQPASISRLFRPPDH